MSGFSGGGRVQMARIYGIMEAVKAGGYPNCRTLAEASEVTQKTIQRDITFMQDQLGVPISYNRSMHGYELTEGSGTLEVLDFRVEDLAALFLARHAVAGVRGTKLANALQPAFEKLCRQLGGKVGMNWRDMDRVFSMREPGGLEVDLTVFGKVADAVMNEREVSFHYRKLGDNASMTRRLRPYHVGEINGGWYVIGYDVMRQGLRTFALQRIKGLRVLKGGFERPADFEIGKYLGGSLWLWDQNSDEAVEVVIEVSGWMARIVQERLWHPTQTTRVMDDYGERVELRMKLGNLEEVKYLVLGWGAWAEVVEPKELRDALREEIERMAGRYD